MNTIAIIGAGMTGIGAARTLQRAPADQLRYSLFEKQSRPGGLCRTEQEDDFLFDYTGHLLHFRTELFRTHTMQLGPPLERHQRSAWVYSHRVYTPYPFQANLHGLPDEVIIECLYEFARERLGKSEREIATFYDWILAHFGAGIARHFMLPYNTKLYRRSPQQLTPETTGRFVPDSDLKMLLRGALGNTNAALGYNATFFYPARGGIEQLVRGLATDLADLRCHCPVVRIDPARRRLWTADYRALAYDYLISTQPLDQLVASLTDAPDPVRHAARHLSHVSVYNINLGIRGPFGTRHWLYLPEPHIPFHRAGFCSNFSSHLAPPEHGSIYLEISYDPCTGIDPDATGRASVAALVEMGVLDSAEQVVVRKDIDIPYGYVHFDPQRTAAVDTIQRYLRAQRILSVGRFGAWEYSSMEDAYLQGVEAAETAMEALSPTSLDGANS